MVQHLKATAGACNPSAKRAAYSKNHGFNGMMISGERLQRCSLNFQATVRNKPIAEFCCAKNPWCTPHHVLVFVCDQVGRWAQHRVGIDSKGQESTKLHFVNNSGTGLSVSFSYMPNSSLSREGEHGYSHCPCQHRHSLSVATSERDHCAAVQEDTRLSHIVCHKTRV